MELLRFHVEVTGSKEVLINGFNSFDSKGTHQLDEKLFANALDPRQQDHVLAEAKKLMARLEHAYLAAARKRGEVSDESAAALMRRIGSGAGGVEGTTLGALASWREKR